MVGPGRLELPTPRLSSVCSNQLSYGPIPDDLSAYPVKLSSKERETWSADFAIPSTSKECRGVFRFDRDLTGPIYVLKSTGKFILIISGVLLFHSFLRKEVIQPQVPLRLPCYDFTPVADPTVVSCLLAVSALPSGKTNSHGVTGGVYKARERIHRGVLIRDY